MELAEGEVQILKGPGLTVTDRRIATEDEQLSVADIAAPRIDTATKESRAGLFMASLGLAFFALGFVFVGPMLWIAGLAMMAFGVGAKIKRPAFAVSAEARGERKTLYTTLSEQEAKLALAALTEALRRSNA